MKHKKCDKCRGWINETGECLCGYWIENYRDSSPLLIFERALLCYDNICEQQNQNNPISGDHWTGNSYVFFKGDYELCELVREFIKNQKFTSDENENQDKNMVR